LIPYWVTLLVIIGLLTAGAFYSLWLERRRLPDESQPRLE